MSSGIRRLNTNDSGRHVWLVKVPQFLLNEWQNLTPDQRVGIVKFHTDSMNQIQVTLHLDEDLVTEDLPTKYQINIASCNPPNMAVFSEDGPDDMSIQGVVMSKCDIKPFDTEEYRTVCKRRMLGSQEHKKAIIREKPAQIIASPVIPRRSVVASSSSSAAKLASSGETIAPAPAVSATQYKRPQSPPDRNKDKRERMPRNELLGLLFNLFKNKRYYKYNELESKVQQPKQYLKEVLEEICILHKKGEHKNHYEVKPEYQHSSEPTGEQQ